MYSLINGSWSLWALGVVLSEVDEHGSKAQERGGQVHLRFRVWGLPVDPKTYRFKGWTLIKGS